MTNSVAASACTRALFFAVSYPVHAVYRVLMRFDPVFLLFPSPRYLRHLKHHSEQLENVQSQSESRTRSLENELAAGTQALALLLARQEQLEREKEDLSQHSAFLKKRIESVEFEAADSVRRRNGRTQMCKRPFAELMPHLPNNRPFPLSDQAHPA